MRPWWHLCWRMLFCKNLEEIHSPRCGGISKAMPNKSTSTEPTTAAAAIPETPAPPRKIYPIVKYGDAVLEKPAATIKTFDAELETLARRGHVRVHVCGAKVWG